MQTHCKPEMVQTGLFWIIERNMKKTRIALVTIFLLSLLVITPTKTFAIETTSPHEEVQTNNTVDYDLPFSGMLPDNPFYIIKKARDHMYIFFTRDHIKKSELLLKVSDKKVSMAEQLAEKEKWDLVVETLEDSQDDCDQMLFSMETSQKIGTSPSPELVVIAQTSNQKREEVMEQLLLDAPEKYQSPIEDIIKKNIDTYNRLDQL